MRLGGIHRLGCVDSYRNQSAIAATVMRVFRVMIGVLVVASASSFSALGQDRFPAENFYYSLKAKMAQEYQLRFPDQVATWGYIPVGLTDCAGVSEFYGWDDAGTARRPLEELAYAVNFMKSALIYHGVPPATWRSDLIEQEEKALRKILSGTADDQAVLVDMEAFAGRLAEAVNKRNRYKEDSSLWFEGHIKGCGAAEEYIIFNHPAGTRLQYMHATPYEVCQSQADPPPGYCDWNDYGGGEVYLSGTIKVRVVGRNEELRTYVLAPNWGEESTAIEVQ